MPWPGGGMGAGVMRVKGTSRGIALAADGNGRYCHASPGAGGAIAVAEAARNVVCVGAQPVAVTDCLNFGNPERPEGDYPTPVIGMLGLLEDVSQHCRPGLTNEGDELFLLGAAPEQPAAALAASEYLKLEHGLIGGAGGAGPC